MNKTLLITANFMGYGAIGLTLGLANIPIVSWTMFGIVFPILIIHAAAYYRGVTSQWPAPKVKEEKYIEVNPFD